jgi:hypothetical protein
MLMTQDERAPLVEAKTDVNVFLNGIVGAVLVGLTLIVDEAVHRPLPWTLSWIYLAPFVLAWLLYLPMPGAAARWGTEVRSAMDLKRLDLYDRLGVRRPLSPSDAPWFVISDGPPRGLELDHPLEPTC